MKLSNTKVALVSLGVFTGMLGLGFAADPLYDTFCKVTGFGGTTRIATAAPDRMVEQEVMVRFDAKRLKLTVTPLADLTDRDGRTTQRGVFLVRTGDPAKRLADLSGRDVMLGPEEEAETHRAAKAAMQQARLAKPAKLDSADSGSEGEVVTVC